MGPMQPPSSLTVTFFLLSVKSVRLVPTCGEIQDDRYRTTGTGWQIQGDGYRVTGKGWRVQGDGYRVTGTGWQIQGDRYRTTGTTGRDTPWPPMGRVKDVARSRQSQSWTRPDPGSTPPPPTPPSEPSRLSHSPSAEWRAALPSHWVHRVKWAVDGDGLKRSTGPDLTSGWTGQRRTHTHTTTTQQRTWCSYLAIPSDGSKIKDILETFHQQRFSDPGRPEKQTHFNIAPFNFLQRDSEQHAC